MDKYIGELYGDMKIIEYLGNWNNNRNYLCECQICHRTKRTQLKHLKNGLGIKHKTCGLGIKQQDKRFYQIWAGMRKRTSNPHSNEWNNYGGRGITSDDYINFIDFYDDFYKSYCEHKDRYGEKDTTIDRIDVNENYTKNNIRWATRTEQQNNTRDQLRTFIGISPDNKKFVFHNIKQFSIEHNLPKENVSATIRGVHKTCCGWHFYEEV